MTLHISNEERGDIGAAIVIVIILLLAGGAGYWLWSRHHTNTPTTNISACTSLSLSQGSSSGTAGTIYKDAVLTNTDSMSCTLTGYPAVFMLDSHGTQVGGGAAPNSLYPISTVTLTPGGKAHTAIAFPQQANFPTGTCSPQGATLQMYVPGIAMALTTPWTDYNCPGFTATALQPGS